MTWSTEDIRAYMGGRSRKHVADRVVHHPNFPRPVVNTSRKSRRWDPDAVKTHLANPEQRSAA